MSDLIVMLEWLESRIADELEREADAYHAESCSTVALSDFHRCDCDGPERTRAQLSALAGVVEVARGLPEAVAWKVLGPVSVVYEGRVDFPGR